MTRLSDPPEPTEAEWDAIEALAVDQEVSRRRAQWGTNAYVSREVVRLEMELRKLRKNNGYAQRR